MRRILVVLVLAAAACGSRDTTAERNPKRIVSLSPSLTEMLYAIGAGEQVVAVDKSSNYPASAPRTDVSGFEPNVEAIAVKNPDLVVYARDAQNIGEELAKIKVRALLLPAANTLDDVYAQVRDLGRTTGHVREAQRLVDQMRAEIRGLTRPSAEVTYYHEVSPDLHTVTSRTFIGSVYALAGLKNIADGVPGLAGEYPKLSAEVVVDADPDFVFLADTKSGQSPQTVAARPGWSGMAAVRSGRVIALDDDIASRWGPRVVDLLRSIVRALERKRAA